MPDSRGVYRSMKPSAKSSLLNSIESPKKPLYWTTLPDLPLPASDGGGIGWFFGALSLADLPSVPAADLPRTPRSALVVSALTRASPKRNAVFGSATFPKRSCTLMLTAAGSPAVARLSPSPRSAKRSTSACAARTRSVIGEPDTGSSSTVTSTGKAPDLWERYSRR